MRDLSRRRFVRGTGAAVAVSALAGCGGGNGDGGNGNGDGGGAGNGDGDGDGGNGGNGDGGGDVPQEIDDHLSDANGYDGSVDDQTGQDEVTVEVGAGDGGLAFAPAAIRVDAGTTVLWEWTGEGGAHNVTSVEGSSSDFGSDLYDEAGQHFEQTFDGAGVQLYVCEPHEAQGMRGAIEVVE